MKKPSKKDQQINITREQWLRSLAEQMKPILEARCGFVIEKYRVSCSFPDKGGKITKKGNYVQGQCWAAEASTDGFIEIFITPVDADKRLVAETLAHELLHAGLPYAGHKKPFQIAARAVGFTKPYTSTPSTPAFWEWVQPLLDTMPEYPHGKLKAYERGAQPLIEALEDGQGVLLPSGAPKPQKNRQRKCFCEKCGYICRTTATWIEKVGAPHCPDHGQMTVEEPKA